MRIEKRPLVVPRSSRERQRHNPPPCRHDGKVESAHIMDVRVEALDLTLRMPIHMSHSARSVAKNALVSLTGNGITCWHSLLDGGCSRR